MDRQISSAGSWEDLKQAFLNNAKEFSEFVGLMKDEELEKKFVKEEYGSYERNIEAMLEHSYYHLGQVVLINKLAKAGQDQSIEKQ